MKKVILLLFLVPAFAIFFSGCENYEQEDADRIGSKGAEMMQMWLDENMPDAQITECSAFTQNIRYTNRFYLTDYAAGKILAGGKEKIFAIDTVTGDVYFENSANTKATLNEIAADFLYETMGVLPEGADDYFECYVLAPFRDENHELKAYQMNYGFDFGLPAGTEDLEAFVRNPESRPLLYVNASITLPEDTDISVYDFAEIEKLCRNCGMLFSSFSIESGEQHVYANIREWLTRAEFYEYGDWLEKDGIYFYGRVRIRQEIRDDLTNEMTISERCFDPKKDLIFEKNGTGYRYYLPNKDWQDEVFYIRTSENSEMAKHSYIFYYYSDVESFISGEYDRTKEGYEVVWRSNENGFCTLSRNDTGFAYAFSHAGILERAE